MNPTDLERWRDSGHVIRTDVNHVQYARIDEKNATGDKVYFHRDGTAISIPAVGGGLQYNQLKAEYTGAPAAAAATPRPQAQAGAAAPAVPTPGAVATAVPNIDTSKLSESDKALLAALSGSPVAGATPTATATAGTAAPGAFALPAPTTTRSGEAQATAGGASSEGNIALPAVGAGGADQSAAARTGATSTVAPIVTPPPVSVARPSGGLVSANPPLPVPPPAIVQPVAPPPPPPNLTGRPSWLPSVEALGSHFPLPYGVERNGPIMEQTNPYSQNNPFEQARMAGLVVKEPIFSTNALTGQTTVIDRQQASGPGADQWNLPAQHLAHGGGLVIHRPAHIVDDATGQPIASLAEVRPEAMYRHGGLISIENHVPGTTRYAAGGSFDAGGAGPSNYGPGGGPTQPWGGDEPGIAGGVPPEIYEGRNVARGVTYPSSLGEGQYQIPPAVRDFINNKVSQLQGPATPHYSGGGLIHVRKFDLGGTVTLDPMTGEAVTAAGQGAAASSADTSANTTGTTTPDTSGIAPVPAAAASAPVTATSSPAAGATNTSPYGAPLPTIPTLPTIPQGNPVIARIENGQDMGPGPNYQGEKTYTAALKSYLDQVDQTATAAQLAIDQRRMAGVNYLGTPEAAAERAAIGARQREQDNTDYKYSASGLKPPTDILPATGNGLQGGSLGPGLRWALLTPEQQDAKMNAGLSTISSSLANIITAAKNQANAEQQAFISAFSAVAPPAKLPAGYSMVAVPAGHQLVATGGATDSVQAVADARNRQSGLISAAVR